MMLGPVSIVNSRHSLDASHIRLTYVTNFYCNQLSIDSVTDLLRKYEGYPAELLNGIEFVIVDDGSPVEYEIPQLSLNITWLRINEDIPWNHSGARNLGVTYAKSDKVLMTDIDHEFPPETLRHLVDAPHLGRCIYKLSRMDARDHSVIRSHANTFFLSRSRFLRHFGYDEEYAGNYGDEDYYFLRYHKYHGSKLRYLPKKYPCFKRVLDVKNSYHSLVRDRTHNISLVKRKKQEMALLGAECGHSRIFLNFTWKVIYKNRLEPLTPHIQPFWRFFWRLRRLSAYLAR